MDPEEYDLSEERFSASLEDVPVHEAYSDAEEAHGFASAARPAIPAVAPEPYPPANDAPWRNEVTSKVERYRARRRRPVRERSLPLDFERAVNREITHGSLASSREEELPAEAPAIAPEPPRYPASVTEPAPPACEPEFASEEEEEESNIIQFPRLETVLPVMPPSFEELAEPMIDRPRILEAPEAVESSAPLSDISVAPEPEEAPVAFELPLQVASVTRRVAAAFVDGLLVLMATALFMVIAVKCGVPSPRERTSILLAAAVPCLLWAMYEYVFVVYAATTIGMQAAHLHLVTFDGVAPRRRLRRWRAIALVLSTMSLALGMIWALLDEDTLCWHDRITRTYLVRG